MGGAGIEVVNEALLVAAGQEGRAGGAALRPAHVAAGAPHAVLRDAVDVRCGYLLRESLAAQGVSSRPFASSFRRIAGVISFIDMKFGFAK